MNRFILFCSLVVWLFSISCKKEDGLFFLRVIPPADTVITALEVYHAGGPVPVDGKYHPVSEWVEIKYTLNNVLQSQILDWDETMYVDEFRYSNQGFHEYLGELERGEENKYYTLQIDYIVEKDDEPFYNQWLGYYYQYWDYYDNSKLTWKTSPD